MMMNRYKKETERFESIISSIDCQELKGIPVFGEEKWSAAEELVLLTSMQNHNYGNWHLLAEILTVNCKKKFTAEEVEEHYVSTYLEGDIAEALNSTLPNTSKNSLIEDHTSGKDDEFLRSVDLNAYENVPPKVLQEIGYMPLREDFEKEYDSAAEKLLTNLEFIDDTDIYDKSMNLILLDTYRNRLIERIEKKKMIKEFRIVEQFYAKTDPSNEINFDDESQYCTPVTRLPSPEPHHNHKMPEVSNPLLPNKKSRYPRLKHIYMDQNLEKKFSTLSDYEGEEEETRSKKKCKAKKRCTFRNNKSKNHLSVQSDNSSDNETVEPDKKSHFTIEDFPCAEQLTAEEKKLCSDIGLMPVYYLHYRCFLLWVDLETSEGRVNNGHMIPPHMTVWQCAEIINFLEKNGFVENQNLLQLADDE